MRISGFKLTLISLLVLLTGAIEFFSPAYSDRGLVLKKTQEQIEPIAAYQPTKIETKEVSAKRIMVERIVVLLNSSHQVFPKNLYFSEEYPQTLPRCVVGQVYAQLACSSRSIS